MKQLTHIRLVNWHLFHDTTITCHGSTYFIGVNGVGKSTILDAIQFALVGGQRDVRFNQAAMAGSRRTLTSYVRGELGTEGQRFLRGDATGLVALEFRNPDGTYFVHGADIDAYEDGRSPDVAYFIVHEAALNDDWFFRAPGHLYDSRAFRRHLEHVTLPGPQARAQVFTRLEDYRFHLLNRLGQLKETFTAKIIKGLAFSPLTNIRDFVHDYLLDESLVEVKNLQEQLETMRHFESLAADIIHRIERLDEIEELDTERRTQRRSGHAGRVPDPSVFPLAMPLIAGPGAMASMILLVGQTQSWEGVVAMHAVMLGVLAIVFVLFLVATPLERALGETGTMVVSRLLGMLLAAMSVQFVLNGARGAGVI